MAVSYGGEIITSSDGSSWTSRNSYTTKLLSDVKYTNNLFAAVGNEGTILRSEDGISWDSVSGVTFDIFGVDNGLSTWVLVGESGNISTISEGEDTFTSRTSGTTANLWRVLFKAD